MKPSCCAGRHFIRVFFLDHSTSIFCQYLILIIKRLSDNRSLFTSMIHLKTQFPALPLLSSPIANGGRLVVTASGPETDVECVSSEQVCVMTDGSACHLSRFVY